MRDWISREFHFEHELNRQGVFVQKYFFDASVPTLFLDSLTYERKDFEVVESKFDQI